MEFCVLLGGDAQALSDVSQAFAGRGGTCELVADTDALVTAALIRDFDVIVVDPRVACGGPVPAYELLRQLGIAAPIAILAVPGFTVAAPPMAGDDVLDVPIDATQVSNLLDKVRAQRAQNSAIHALFSGECDELAAQFRAALPAKLAELDTAVADRDFGRLRALVHRLKGVAGNFGFPEITERCAAIESQLRAGLTEDPACQTLAMTASVRSFINSAGQAQTGAHCG